MDLKLKPFDFAQAAARAGMATDGTPLKRPARPEAAGGFQNALAGALKSVSDSQLDVDRMQREVQLENPTVGIEDTMVAMQKAQIGFQATVAVRNRLVSAYTEIMNMQV